MIKIIKIIIVITVIIGWLGTAKQVGAVIKKAGNIEVITDEPLFADATIWYPGMTVEKSFQVKNRGRGAKTVQIETENESETRQLARVLTVRINEGNRGIYGASEDKTLRNFFDSAGINLAEMLPDDNGKVFSVAISMPAAAGNQFQDGRTKFDLRIGFLGESSSAVTVSAESSGVLGESEETEGKEGSPAESWRIQAGEEGLEEGEELKESGEQRAAGEVAGVSEAGVNWRRWGIFGGILGLGGLAGWAWLRLRRKQVY